MTETPNNAAETPLKEAVSSENPAAEATAIEKLQAQFKDAEQKYLYLYAEFENYKKRIFKERQDLVKFGWENVARDLLQVVDNLDRAVGHAPPQVDPSFLSGIQMVLTHFKDTLAKQGVQTIPSLSKLFDPQLHEAVSEEDSSDHPAGHISKEHLPGYTLHGRLLRPSRVSVSKGKPA